MPPTQMPPLSLLKSTAQSIVWDAVLEGQERVKELTPRLVRKEVERVLGLDEGALDVKEYKGELTAIIRGAVKDGPPMGYKDAKDVKEEPEMVAEEEGHEEIVSKPNPKKRKSIQVAQSSDEEDDEKDDDEYDDLSAPKPKAKAALNQKKPRPSKGKSEEEEVKVTKTKKRRLSKNPEDEGEDAHTPPDSESPKSKKPIVKRKSSSSKDSKAYKTPEHVPTSDMEQDELGPIHVGNVATSATVDKSDSKPTAPARLKSKKVKETAKPKPTKSKSKATTDDDDGDKEKDGSETELEDLIDSPPKKKKASTKTSESTTKGSSKPKAKRASTSKAPLTKDEETIKRLKSFVLACGVRKVWSKVFQNADSLRQQIVLLQQILADLGMKGRMSLDQAKSIKAKRELAQELEDVQQFEKNILKVGTSRSSRNAKTKREVEVARESRSAPPGQNGKDDDNVEEEDEAPIPRRRSGNAHNSIMAYLQGQGSDED